MNHARSMLAGLLERDDPSPSLAEVAFWIAAEEYPELDVPACLARLDTLAIRVERLRARLHLNGPEALRVALAEEQGYHGNRDAYYDPRNSYLSDVLELRTGIPITLSILYVEVARRCGLAAEGVSFPGHFLVRVEESGDLHVLDPFHGGRRLDEDDCALLLSKVAGGRVTFQPELLEPAPWRQIIFRLLANLKNVYLADPADNVRALRTINTMLLVRPDSLPEIRDRGLLLYRLENYREAIATLEGYLDRSGTVNAEDHNLRERITRMKRQLSS